VLVVVLDWCFACPRAVVLTEADALTVAELVCFV